LTLSQRFTEQMAVLFDGAVPQHVGIALSGGCDSMALLGLVADWAKNGCKVTAITVDHGLRAVSADEAVFAQVAAERLGVTHATLLWKDWDGRGNLQAEARQARYALMTNWQHDRAPDMTAILLGHTLDDQAETVLMRLARGSGVDGLAGMTVGRGSVPPGSTAFLRPLLNERRADLRTYLNAAGTPWLDDPSNDDTRFERVRIRQALAHLEPLGISPDRLASTAQSMQRAKLALDWRADEIAQQIAHEPAPGIVSFDRLGLFAIDPETRLRLVAHALKSVTSAPHRPRLATLERTLDQAAGGEGSTLHGALVTVTPTQVFISRELEAVKTQTHPFEAAQPWDQRWRFSGSALIGTTISALGEAGVSQINRPPEIPRAALLSYPAAWRGENVAFVPEIMAIPAAIAKYIVPAAFPLT
jgi:tRNA(Ile)-lysidine synthase